MATKGTHANSSSSLQMEWDHPDNAENPYNWSKKKKWINVGLISCQGTLSPMSSTILAVGSQRIAQDFHLDSLYTPNLPVGLYVLGLGLGPLSLAPLSEVYGRRIVYLASFTIFTILNVGCALAPNITALAILRFLSGIFGSAGPTLGGASIGDMFHRRERGGAQSIYSLGPTAGPVIAPLIGAFIVDGTGTWRWLMWVMVIAGAVVVVICLCLLRETYAPVLLREKGKTLQDDPDCENDDSKLLNDAPRADVTSHFRTAITRPFRMLFFAPICTVMALYMSLIYGILYLFLVSIPLLYGAEPVYGLYSYRWTHGLTGLAYLAPGVGTIIGILTCRKGLDRSYAYMAQRTLRSTGSDQPPPECRMLFLQIGMAIVPAGLIIFAWTAHFQTQWIAPLIGTALFSLGMFFAYVCIQTYVVDVFEKLSASALAAITFSRSLISCIFAITGFQLFKALGYAWGTMLIAFICIAMLPLPLLLYKFGTRLRRHPVKY